MRFPNENKSLNICVVVVHCVHNILALYNNTTLHYDHHISKYVGISECIVTKKKKEKVNTLFRDKF